MNTVVPGIFSNLYKCWLNFNEILKGESLGNITKIHNCIRYQSLTHWGRVTHICVSKIIIIGSDNGLSPDRRQAIIWTNAGILLIGPWGTNFSEISTVIQTFSFKKMHVKMSSAKWRPFCFGLNVLTCLLKTRWVDGTPTTEVTPVTTW